MAKVASVFVSATTRDLKSYRSAAGEALQAGGITPVVQEEFGPDYRSVAGMLQRKIAACDAVICLVGYCYGAEPSRVRDESRKGRRSYTQMEYDIAVALGKRIYLFLADNETLLDKPPEEDEQKRQLQLAYLDELKTLDKPWKWLRSHAELKHQIAQIVRELPAEALIHFEHRPKEPAFFAGREFEIGQLDRALTEPGPGIIVVIGIGGQGKTSLVYEWLKRNRPTDFDAVFWCTCYRGGFTFDQFLDRTLFHFLKNTFRKENHPELADRANLLVKELQDHRTLLVLDGFERWLRGWYRADWQEIETFTDQDRAGCDPVLDEFLRDASGLSNGSHIVLTTRAKPHVLDTARHTVVPVYPDQRAELQGLAEADAIELLRKLGVCGGDGDIIDIVKRYEYHPLALSILGAQVVKRFSGDITMVSGRSQLIAGDLRGLLEITQQHLPGREQSQRFLCVAALCVEDPSLELMAAALGKGRRESISDLLERAVMLSEWQLLKWDGEARAVRLHPLIKAHFSRLVRKKDSRRIHTRLSRYYAALPPPENARLLPEVRGRILAIEHARLAGDLKRCSDLLLSRITADYPFVEWLVVCGHLTTGIEILGRLSPKTDKAVSADFLISRGAMLQRLGRLREAETDLDRAIGKLDTLSPLIRSRRTKLAAALNNRGNVCREAGDLSKALRFYSRSIRVFPKRLGIRQKLEFAKSLMNRGSLLRFHGTFCAAERDLRQAIQICEHMTALDHGCGAPLLAEALWKNGNLLIDREDLDGALVELRRAAVLYESLLTDGRSELDPALAHVRIACASALRKIGRAEDADEILGQSINRLDQLVEGGAPEWEPYLGLAYVERAETRFDLGQSESGFDDSARAVAILQRLKMQRQDLEQAWANALFVRARLRYSFDKAGAADDRAVSVEAIRSLGERGANEVRLEFLARLEPVLNQLLPNDEGEAVSLLNQALEDINFALRNGNRSERLDNAAGRLIDWTTSRLAVLAAAGFGAEILEETVRLRRSSQTSRFSAD